MRLVLRLGLGVVDGVHLSRLAHFDPTVIAPELISRNGRATSSRALIRQLFSHALNRTFFFGMVGFALRWNVA